MKYKSYKGKSIAVEPSLPGVWKTREAGVFFVRGRKKNPRTNKMTEVKLFLEAKTAKQAYKLLQEELEKRISPPNLAQGINFQTYAEELLEKKLTLGDIKSKAGEKKWRNCLSKHLVPTFGPLLMDQIQRQDIEAWKLSQAKEVKADRLAPASFNSRLAILRVILGTAEVELDLPKNPMRGIKPLDNDRRTYTRENPNALHPNEVAIFLAGVKELSPKHYAAIYLGFATGLRPSSIRPIRRQGNHSDLLWEEGVLLVRRSHTVAQEVMERTKTGKDVVIYLPQTVMEVLRWHVEEILLGSRERFSDLLFPSKQGKLHGPNWLQKPFREVSEELMKRGKLKAPITPRAMRRTFQDLARAAQLHDLVTRSVSGHATESMHFHYSTVNPEEQRAGLNQVVQFLGSSGGKGGVSRRKSGRKNRLPGDQVAGKVGAGKGIRTPDVDLGN